MSDPAESHPVPATAPRPRVTDFSHTPIYVRSGSRWQRRPPRVVPVANVRARIAYILLAVFTSTVGMGFAAVAAGWGTWTDLKDFITPLITAEVGLLGAVMGFYYATHEQHLTGIQKVDPAQERNEDGLDP